MRARLTGPPAVVSRLERMTLRVRLVAIVLFVLAAALLFSNLATAYFMQRDLMGRVDSELESVAKPVARQALQDLTRGDEETTPTGYAFVLFPMDGETMSVNPTSEDMHPAVPRLSLDDERVRRGKPFTVPSVDGQMLSLIHI